MSQDANQPPQPSSNPQSQGQAGIPNQPAPPMNDMHQQQMQQPPMGYPPPKQGMSGGVIALIIIGCVMVGILVIGLIAGVIGVAVSGVMDKNKVKLDAESLTKFASTVEIALVDPTNSPTLRRMSDEGGEAREYFRAMYESEVLDYDAMKRLAGTSGTVGSTDDYRSPTAYGGGICIFTGPESIRDLNRLINPRSGEGERCVVLTYNADYVDMYPLEGIPIVVSGSTKAEVMTSAQIAATFPDSEFAEAVRSGQEIRFSDWYGRTPFHHIVPR